MQISETISLEGQFLQSAVESALRIAKIGRDHDHDFNELITTTIVHFQTSIPQTQQATAGGARWDLEGHRTIQGGNINGAAEGSVRREELESVVDS